MNYKVETIPTFDKQVKRLSKKHKSLKNDLAKLFSNLENDPTQGVNLFENNYKIRLAIKSKGKGKSGGARVITHFKITSDTVYLLSIYDKSETQNIHDNDIIELLKQIQ